jgi:UDP-perosamine 4-acetyltransferase
MKPKVILLGAGKHAKVVLDVLGESDEFDVVGCTSTVLDYQAVLGFSVRGDDSVLPRLLALGIQHAFVAIGDNRIRLERMEHIEKLGFVLINVVSRRALLSSRARFGKGVAIFPGAVVNVDAVIGDGAIINTGAIVEHDCEIGRGAHIASGVSLAGCVRIGEGTLLGTGCSVIPDIEIGAWSVIGAGSAVIRRIPGGALAVGVPAVIKKVNQSL